MTDVFDQARQPRTTRRPDAQRPGRPRPGAQPPDTQHTDAQRSSGRRPEDRLERLRAERPRRLRLHPPAGLHPAAGSGRRSDSGPGSDRLGGAVPGHDAPPRMDPRFAKRWVEARREEGRRRLRLLTVAVAAAVVVALGVGSLYSPIFSVRHVNVSVAAAGPVRADQVVSVAGLGHKPMLDADGAAVARRVDSNPWLADAKVDLKWPSTVDIQVTERKSLAQVEVESLGKWAEVDVTGRVLQMTSERVPHLPALSAVGQVPQVGAWLAGAPGPAAPATGLDPAVNVNAESDSTNVPSGTTSALSFIDLLPSSLRAEVVSFRVGDGDNLILTLKVKNDAAPVQVVLGDSSELATKAGALETLAAHGALRGVRSVSLTVPSRPSVTELSGQR